MTVRPLPPGTVRVALGPKGDPPRPWFPTGPLQPDPDEVRCPAVPQVDDELREEIGTAALITLLTSRAQPNSGELALDVADAVLALPAVRRLIADAAKVQRVRDVIAFLDESAEVHAEQGQVTAHYPIAQRLRRALEDTP